MNSHLLGNIFAILVSLAGWFYLTHSHNAQYLSPLEGEPRNRMRIRLRRIGGLLMLLCAICILGGNNLLDDRVALACWLAVIILLFGIVLLALIDLRLTIKLRKRKQP